MGGPTGSAGPSAKDLEVTRADTEEPRSPEPGDAGLSLGATVGRYVVLEHVGAGGMGVVYAAYDPELDRRVALKILRPTHGEGDAARGRARLLREAQAMARISHPNVIPVHDVGEHHGRVFVAMEFVEGQTLKAWLVGTRDWQAVLRVFTAAGRGLAAAHAKGLIHRDFKPDNVMIGVDGRVRVLDFGLARGADPGVNEEKRDAESPRPTSSPPSALEEGMTELGTVLGTPAYMAPEQMLGLSTDARTDQFSFCVALHEGLYGDRPFEGDTEATLAVGVTEGKLRPVPADSKVPAFVRRALVRGLAKRPEERHPSMEGLLEELQPAPASSGGLWVVIGAIALTGALAVALLWKESAAPPPPVDPCANATARVREAWSTSEKARLASAFEGSGLSYANQLQERVHAALDEHATALDDGFRTTCRTAKVENTSSDQLYDLQRDCLTRATVALTTAIDVVAGSTDENLAEAPKIAGTLPNPGRCLDAAYLRAGVRPPDDPEVEVQVAQIRDEIERAELLQAAGRYTEGAAVSAAALERAEGLDYEPVAVEAKRRHARLIAMDGDRLGSVAIYRDAYFAARRLGHARVAVEVALDLVWVLGVGGDFAEALEWARHGQAEAELLRDPSLVGRAFMYRALVHTWQQDFEEALRLHDQAREQLTKDRSVSNQELASLELNRGLTLLHLERYDEAAVATQSFIDRFKAEFGDQHPKVGLGLTNMAIIALDSGDARTCLKRLDQVEALWKPALNPKDERFITLHKVRGEAYLALKEPANAIPEFESALRRGRETHDGDGPVTLPILTYLADAYIDTNAAAKAREALADARAVEGRSEADDAEIARLEGRLTARP